MFLSFVLVFVFYYVHISFYVFVLLLFNKLIFLSYTFHPRGWPTAESEYEPRYSVTLAERSAILFFSGYLICGTPVISRLKSKQLKTLEYRWSIRTHLSSGFQPYLPPFSSYAQLYFTHTYIHCCCSFPQFFWHHIPSYIIHLFPNVPIGWWQ